MKVNSDNDVIQEPKRIYFDNHYFKTDDEELINFIKNLPNFGADYVIVEEAKQIEDKTPKVGIVQMNTPEQEKDNEVANLRKEVQELKGLLMQVASKSPQPIVESVNEENEQIPDPRVEALKKAREAKKQK